MRTGLGRPVGNKVHLLALGAVIALAVFIRFWAAPLSAGPDVAQFWAFAKVFQLNGLDFYKFADATLEIFPFSAWGYVYPPVWLLILRLALLVVPSSSATGLMVDAGWRVAMKAPIIMADIAIGLLLYWAVPGSKLRKLLFTSLWLLHPTAWFESAVFGQFDAIAAALLLAALILLTRHREGPAFLLAALAVMTKQHTFIPVAIMVIICSRYMNKRRLLINCSIAGGVVALLSIPFLLTGNFTSYARSLFLPGMMPDYQNPLVFTFSGSGAVLTYLNNVFGWETSQLFPYTLPLLVIALVITGFLSYKKQIGLLQGALAGFLVFISLAYRVNYQYLVVYIPLAILLAAQTRYRSEKILALALAMVPAIWVWISSVPGWFNYFEPTAARVIPELARIGMVYWDPPDYVYVCLAVLIMGLAMSYVVCVFVRWRYQDKKPPAGSTSGGSWII